MDPHRRRIPQAPRTGRRVCELTFFFSCLGRFLSLPEEPSAVRAGSRLRRGCLKCCLRRRTWDPGLSNRCLKGRCSFCGSPVSHAPVSITVAPGIPYHHLWLRKINKLTPSWPFGVTPAWDVTSASSSQPALEGAQRLGPNKQPLETFQHCLPEGRAQAALRPETLPVADSVYTGFSLGSCLFVETRTA